MRIPIYGFIFSVRSWYDRKAARRLLRDSAHASHDIATRERWRANCSSYLPSERLIRVTTASQSRSSAAG